MRDGERALEHPVVEDERESRSPDVSKIDQPSGGRPVSRPLALRAARARSSGGVNSLKRLYLPRPDSRGRNEAHASSTLASAPRSFSSDAFAFQLVFAARTPAWSAVRPPGWTCTRSVGTSTGAASSMVEGAVAGAVTGPCAVPGGASCPGPGACAGAGAARTRAPARERPRAPRGAAERPAPAFPARSAVRGHPRRNRECGQRGQRDRHAREAPGGNHRPHRSLHPSGQCHLGGREPSPSWAATRSVMLATCSSRPPTRSGHGSRRSPASDPAASSRPTATARCGAATSGKTSFTRSSTTGAWSPPRSRHLRRTAREHGLSDAGHGRGRRAQDLRRLLAGRLPRRADVRTDDVVLRGLDAERGRGPSPATSSTGAGWRRGCTRGAHACSSARGPPASRRSS